jgi:hypothetical protein
VCGMCVCVRDLPTRYCLTTVNRTQMQVPASFSRLVHAMSGGNPLFARKFVQAMRSVGLVEIVLEDVAAPAGLSSRTTYKLPGTPMSGAPRGLSSSSLRPSHLSAVAAALDRPSTSASMRPSPKLTGRSLRSFMTERPSRVFTFDNVPSPTASTTHPAEIGTPTAASGNITPSLPIQYAFESGPTFPLMSPQSRFLSQGSRFAPPINTCVLSVCV